MTTKSNDLKAFSVTDLQERVAWSMQHESYCVRARVGSRGACDCEYADAVAALDELVHRLERRVARVDSLAGGNTDAR